jgi:ribosome maturation factor RimP
MSQAEELYALIEPLVAAEGLELFDVEVLPRLVRVAIDRPGGGVDLDSISDLTAAISSLLDAHEPLPGSYALEVSSPGLERPLRRPDHFRRFAGSVVSVKTRPEVEGERRLEGVLGDVDDAGFSVTVVGDDLTETVCRLDYGDVEKARTVFEWGPPPKPGKVGSRPSKKKTKTERAS